MAGHILVFIEHYDGEIRAITRQLVSKGRELAESRNDELVALVLGHNVEPVVRSLSGMGMKTIFVVDDEQFEQYNPEIYVSAVSKAINQISPQIVLFGDTHMTREIAPAISVLSGIPFLSSCTNLELADTKLVVTQPKYSGSIFVRAELEPLPKMVMVSLQGGVGNSVSLAKHSMVVVPIKVANNTQEARTRTVETSVGKIGEVDITKADVIVAGGRGLKARENLSLLRELAAALGGVVACSRPLCDLGWLPLEYLVGMSGKTVSPKVYIACGISGATQHLAGMSGARRVIAINSDVNAPIFRVADYGVVGDLFQVLPAVIREAKQVNKTMLDEAGSNSSLIPST